MSSLNYTTYVSELSALTVILSSDPNFQTMIPASIDYHEQRIYRELDLQSALVYDITGILSTASRNFTLPTTTGQFITCDRVNITVPSTAVSQTNIVPLVPASRDFVDNAFPSRLSSNCGQPEYFAIKSGFGGDTPQITLGPSPDLPYPVEVVGIQRPASLSSANSSTLLTQYVPDLVLAAAMVFFSGYMRDFGAQSDNPQMSQSWENQYQLLKQSAAVEVFRTKFESEGWTAKQPNPIATPKRV